MTNSEMEVIEDEAEDLNKSDKLVLTVLSKKKMLRTRLQKTALMYCEVMKDNVVDHIAYNFGGYSEDVDESLETLVDIGAVYEDRSGYSVSDYGKRLLDYLLNRDDENKMVDNNVDKIIQAVGGVSDRVIVGLTYHYYPTLSSKSTIKDSVEKMNENIVIDDTPLSEIDKDTFEDYIKNGKHINAMERGK